MILAHRPFAFIMLCTLAIPGVARGNDNQLEGDWTSKQVKSELQEIGPDDAVELQIRTLASEDGKKYQESYQIEGDYYVEAFLRSKDGKRRRMGDSQPGWIDKKGRIWLGSIAGALVFNVEVMTDPQTKRRKMKLTGRGSLIVLVPKES